jgi:hypothetical protein
MKKKAYRWQPELSITIICWSSIFAILFVSLILSLEYTRPYLVSNVVLVFFFLFGYLGIRRQFVLHSKQLIIKTMLPFHDKIIPYSSITKVVYGKKSLEIYSDYFTEGSKLFLMRQKTKQAFIEELKKNKILQANIHEDSALGVNRKS